MSPTTAAARGATPGGHEASSAGGTEPSSSAGGSSRIDDIAEKGGTAMGLEMREKCESVSSAVIA